ncbi:MAG: aspartate--tRNA ligase [Alphaproteobacteria bacterium]|nr:aspartate--tRNA ligase [Alphaproteobacteria bacterium]
MQNYRTKLCGQLRASNAGETVVLAGWIQTKRDHGNLLFVDLRDNDGVTQCVVDTSSPCFGTLEKARPESVVRIEGKVLTRTPETVNPKMSTGEIEVGVEKVDVLGEAQVLPFLITADSADLSEEQRLTYRFLDLRRTKPHANILMRNRLNKFVRDKMWEMGFTEFQTPILTSSSPEGARDYLVPSRVHKGEFYALPQSPQQFKQLLMVAGFDRYFQLAPCFRDEDSRADRSPGEFYQIDWEMSFVTQDEIMEVGEKLISAIFKEFAPEAASSVAPFPRIPFDEAMKTYGTDKPDLRNPLKIVDVSEVFAGSEFGIFANAVAEGGFVRAIKAPKTEDRPRSWFDKLNAFAVENEMGGLGYIVRAADGNKGPIAKKLDDARLAKLFELTELEQGDSVFFICGKGDKAALFAGKVRNLLGHELDLFEKNAYRFCWVVDFPFYEQDPETGKPMFSHNPFSMPQGELEALTTNDPLTIKAYQFDMVGNGLEMLSGAIRNHRPDVMYKAFEIAGYGPEVVEAKFGGMLNAFKYGAPPHGGAAFGFDRIVMMLENEEFIREVIAFPFNQQAQDLLMHAPSPVTETQLREVHIKLR